MDGGKLLSPPTWSHMTGSDVSFRSTRSRDPHGVRRPKRQRRAVLKNGECNVLQNHIHHRKLRFMQDLYTTLVDVQWRWTLLVFALSFILSWLGFAVVWFLVASAHGDLTAANYSSGWTPCVVNLHSFTSAFLFSMETQQSIGYGTRSTTEECPEAIFVMILQVSSGGCSSIPAVCS
uniref:Potassium channel inwardly rectifying transmembrane domain-containing protein n=1 Tax=Timema cristinae TaxID=61476 RepID=A0A7R9GU31_TIMCR|nr:unnamed protein product [Timema cristinae]